MPRRPAAQTAINMASNIMSAEFQDWLYDNWDEVEQRHEFDRIMDYYIHGNTN